MTEQQTPANQNVERPHPAVRSPRVGELVSPGAQSTKISLLVDSPSGQSAASSIASSEPSSWPELGEEALAGLAGEIVSSATESSEADPAAVLATLLSLTGIAVGREPFVRIGDDEHHARLNSAIVGQSARGRKGTSEKPIQRIWQVASQTVGPLSWRPGPMSSGEGLIFAIRDGDGKEDGDPGVVDKRMFIVEAEFAAPLRAMQRQGNILSTAIRCAWDGRTLEPLTKSSPIKASNPHIGIVGHITIQELKPLLSTVEVFNGFANRFLWWQARRNKLVPLAKGMNEAIVSRLGSEYAARISIAMRFDEIKFSDNARDLYSALYPTITEDRAGLFGVVTARAEAQVIRLALTYALLDASNTITEEHLGSALAVWQFCDNSASRIFGNAEPDPLEGRILAALAGGPLATTDLNRALSGHISTEYLKAALENLQGRGRIDRCAEPTAGRTRVVWHLRAGFEVGGLSARSGIRVLP